VVGWLEGGSVGRWVGCMVGWLEGGSVGGWVVWLVGCWVGWWGFGIDPK
jgi:hypothetical protein